MVSSFLKKLVTAAVLLASSASVIAAPTGLDSLSHEARDLVARATPAAPHFVAYSDKWVNGENGPPAPSAINGFNVFVLSFYLISGPADQAAEWVSLSDSQRSSIKSQYAAAGISLIVSAFGSTDEPTTAGADPVATANALASFVKQYQLDGVDVDYEDFAAINAQNGSAENWLISFTKQLRNQLPAGQYILSHAPVAPWFEPNRYASGAYLAVNNAVGNLIDWYNIQFYNQGQSEYTTCNGLLEQSSSQNPNTALFQIAANGVSLDKLVIGKPALASGDASNGYIDPNTLAGCVAQAKSQGWDGGVMVWEYPDAASSWITTVRSQSWPVGSSTGSSNPPPPPPPSGSGNRIHPQGNTSKCLDVQGAVFANGTPVQIYDCNGTNAQNWVINAGQTTVQVAGTNYCLDAGTSPADGTQMKIWECYSGLPQQTWYLTSDNRIALENQGFCLDDTNGSLNDGTIAQIWECTDNDNYQVWTLS